MSLRLTGVETLKSVSRNFKRKLKPVGWGLKFSFINSFSLGTIIFNFKIILKRKNFFYWIWINFFLIKQVHKFWLNQERYLRRTTIFIFSLCIRLVTQFNGSALGVLKRHYITKISRELLIDNSRFLIYNSLNQLLYYTI